AVRFAVLRTLPQAVSFRRPSVRLLAAFARLQGGYARHDQLFLRLVEGVINDGFVRMAMRQALESLPPVGVLIRRHDDLPAPLKLSLKLVDLGLEPADTRVFGLPVNHLKLFRR